MESTVHCRAGMRLFYSCRAGSACVAYGVHLRIRKPVDRVLHGLPHKAVQMVSDFIFIDLDGIDD